MRFVRSLSVESFWRRALTTSIACEDKGGLYVMEGLNLSGVSFVCQHGIEEANKNHYEGVLLDTALKICD